jgi:hypothetical protein
MSVRHRLKLETSRKLYAVSAVAIAALTMASASTANGQVSPKSTTPNWTITIVATGSNERPHYTVVPAAGSGACDNDENPSPTASILTVCPGDTIEWTAKTTSAGQSKMYLFQEDSYLFDSSGVPAQGFEAVNGIIDAKVDPKATPGDEHKYYVSVYDNVTKRLYVDDPKIMIGTGSKVDLENRIKEECKTLIRLSKRSEHEDEVISGCHEILKDAKTVQNPPK